MAEISRERLLMTFALFAYNQEKYIREAVEGAFSQTYEALEIILSDDCSTDRTFEIMQKMAAEYDGPHEVRVRRTQENVGTLNHVLEVAKIAKGYYLVVAAGDDISLPDRTGILLYKFTSEEIAAVSSDDIIINESGEVQECYEERIAHRNHWHQENSAWLHGGSAAYRTSLLKRLPLPQKKILFEDMALICVFQILQMRTVRLQDRLVKYRFHKENISSRHTRKSSFDVLEQQAMVRWRRASDAKAYSVEVASCMLHDRRDFTLRKCKESSDYLNLLAEWPNLLLGERIKLVKLAVRQGELHACVPRLFGWRIFSLIKNFKASIS